MRYTPALIILLALTLPAAAQESRTVDFRYAPAWSFSVISFPDDWQKTVVTTEGALGYNFAPGPYAKPLTSVSIGIEGEELTVMRQYFTDPRFPVAVTEFSSAAGNVRQEAFSLLPSSMGPVSNALMGGRLQRLNGLNGTLAWANPPGKSDPAFRNIAWGVNRPIHYRVRVAKGSRKMVALGIAESYKPKPGMRILNLQVEGAPPRTLDPLRAGSQNQPYVLQFDSRDDNGDGYLDIIAGATEESDPNTILSALWVFPDARVTADQIMSGEVSGRAELYYNCGPDNVTNAGYARIDALRAEFSSGSATPVIRIRSHQAFELDQKRGIVTVDKRPFLISHPKPIARTGDGGDLLLTMPRGTRKVDLIVIQGGSNANDVAELPDLDKELNKAITYWQQRAPIPRGKIAVPDSGIQYLLDANIRNLYQNREVVDGFPQFQPGPSVYRGLWMHDALWHIDAAMYLGDTASARRAIANIVRYQQPDGRVRIMSPIEMQAETPVFIYLLCRYAQLTHDSVWLTNNWNHIATGIAWLEQQRTSTLTDSADVFAGLLPPGFADGGLGGKTAEYSGVISGLIGTKAAINAARRLGKEGEADSWQRFYDEFFASFTRALQRDIRRDKFGNMYVPVKMADTSSTMPPHRAQWAFIQLQSLGHAFDIHDALIVNIFRMLHADNREGLPTDTGWLQGGLWPFFASILGMGDLWQRNYPEARDLLYAIANHATPLGTWVEEQLPRSIGTRTTGDASNATASALYIAFVRKAIALERDSTLDLLAGVPAEWYKPGSTIALNDVPTEFGSLRFRTYVDPNGASVTIDVSPMKGRGPAGGPVIFLRTLKNLGFTGTTSPPLPDRFEGSWAHGIHLVLRREQTRR